MAGSGHSGKLKLIWLPAIISFVITTAVTVALYTYELENRKELRRAELAQKAVTLSEHLDQSFTDVNFALIESTRNLINCSPLLFRFAHNQLLDLPQIAELRYTDARNKVHCNSWQHYNPPLEIHTPQNHKGLNFSGPLLIDDHPGPGFQLFRSHPNGGKVQAVIRKAWLKNQVKFFHKPLGYMAIIDSDSGVPIVMNGRYALPVGLETPLFPVNVSTHHEGWLDNRREHFTFIQPLLTQPQLSVIISQDQDSLYLDIFGFNTSWLGTASGAFALILLISYRIQRRLVDPIRQIKSAIQRNEFFNLYQPLVCSKTQRIVGCEVLMRWQHPFKGLLPPMTFIPLAEQSGLIKEMTLRQIDQTIRDLSPILQQHPHFKVSVNICAAHMLDNTVVNTITERATFLPGMVLEITEHQVVEHCSEQIQQALQQFKRAGIKIAMDDFGTGYCGLTYLSTLPIDILKADRSFVAALGTDSINADVLSTIFELTQKLGMSAIAEGVEKQAQADILRQMGFPLQQGWLHGYPMSAPDFNRTFAKGKKPQPTRDPLEENSLLPI